jgi:phospholipid/cholesterol/gamma-HCH transport system substrate-binding protein
VRRIAAIVLVLGCAAAVAVLAFVATGDDDGNGGPYQVRAIFDSAFAIIPGEDVKVAGVKVGKIESLDVTPDKKAAVVLRIDKPGFGDFRKDASCIVRPQSLIGEKFVECTPTQPRPAGDPAPPALQRIEEGDGKGQYLLPVSNTQRSVDIDLINNIYRLPERQRLSIILSELGTGLAGRGEDLNQVIRRADPALMETDKVLAVLKQQNQALADLARDSDTVLAPLAERRGQVADFIVQARDVSQATAERRGALEESFSKLPAFLTELRPTLRRLGGLSDEMTPVLEDLGAQAPNINRLIQQLGPLAQASRPAISSLGDASVVGEKAMREIRPLTQDVNELAASSAPVAKNLDDILVSLRDTGGIERAMDYLFFQMTSINGFDASGHYLRAGLLINPCSTYAIQRTTGCEATFSGEGAGSGDAAGRSLYLRRQAALLKGMPIDEVLRRFPEPGAQRSSGRAGSTRTVAASDSSGGGSGGGDASGDPLRMPDAVLPSSGTSTPMPAPGDSQSAASSGAAGAPAPAASSAGSTAADSSSTSSSVADSPTGRLLDYLLGGGS